MFTTYTAFILNVVIGTPVLYFALFFHASLRLLEILVPVFAGPSDGSLAPTGSLVSGSVFLL